MTDWNKELHTYLQDHTTDITDKWLSLRNKEDDSIYSADACKETEQMLREQNTATNCAVISSLLGHEDDFENRKKDWAQLVAESRIASNTPIPDVLEALSKVRKAFWKQVEQFIRQKEESISLAVVSNWSKIIHRAFDELNIAYSEAYFQLTNQRLSAQQELINELGSPVIKITESVGVFPVVGDIDTRRAQTIMDTIPEKCMSSGITNLYVDLSGVAFIDKMVINQIFQLTNILNLLGIETTITGIRPEIAQTAVQLGIDFTQINTSSTLQQALETY